MSDSISGSDSNEGPGKASGKDLSEWIQRAIRRDPGELPVFPVVALRIVDLLESPHVELADAAAMVSQDQVIASQILRTANSSLYLGASPATTVSAAIMRVGLREASQIAMIAAGRSLFDPEDRVELEVHPQLWTAIWHQSLVGAYGGRLVASELGVGDPEQIFLGALMRHVGRLLILKVVARGLVRGRLPQPVSEEQLEQAMARLQIPIGVDYLRRNRLPDVFVAAAADGAEASLREAIAGQGLEVMRLVDGLTDVLAIAPFASGRLGAAGARSAMALGLDEPRLEYFVLQLKALSDQVRELL